MAARMYSRKSKLKREREQSYCRLTVAVLQVVLFCQNVSYIAAQGHLHLHSSIQAEASMHDAVLFSRQEPSVVSESGKMYAGRNTNGLPMSLVKFDPPFLDFETQYIGIPEIRIVHIYNPSSESSLHLKSISALTSHFHSSFFDEKVVPAGGNTTFQVVFLARLAGNVENTLFIDTAVGTFSYQVFGVGVPNPYRLRPFLGAKVSLNSTFSPLIKMYNPTQTPLKVTEIYSSSGYLQLQLPGDHDYWEEDSWEIPPYETVPLMRMNFVGLVADNHTAFIRIKTNQTEDQTNFLILPVEVEVSQHPGIFSSMEMLDFGTVRSYDEPRTLSIFLQNTGPKDVQITSIKCQFTNPAVKIEFKPIKLKHSNTYYTRVANISFHVSQLQSQDDLKGKIVIKPKERSYQPIILPFEATVLNGTLGFNESSSRFLVSPPQHKSSSSSQLESTELKTIHNSVTLTNLFDFPLVLHKITMRDGTDKFYKITDFDSPVTLPPGQSQVAFTVKCDAEKMKMELAEKNQIVQVNALTLHTNASTYMMELQSYNGHLNYDTFQSATPMMLDYGIIGTNEYASIRMIFDNQNPMEVEMFDPEGTVPGVSFIISHPVDCDKNGQPKEEIKQEPPLKGLFIKPGAIIIFDVRLKTPEVETEISGSVFFHTSYETIEMKLKAKVAIGALTSNPPVVEFKRSFPGMIVSHTVSISSTFGDSAKIGNVSSTDKRFIIKKLKKIEELKPGNEVKFAKVYFDSRQNCKPKDCYVGLPFTTPEGHDWSETLGLEKHASEIDMKLYQEFRGRWKTLQDNNQTKPSSHFILNNSVVPNFSIPASASLYWPKLSEHSHFTFPLTLVGKKAEISLKLWNPSEMPILVQILPISAYPDVSAVLSTLNWSQYLLEEGFITNNLDLFKITSTSNASEASDTWLKWYLIGKTNESRHEMMLGPNEEKTVQVQFSPLVDITSSTVILMRNNLTVLEAIYVKGTGVREQLKLGGKLSNNPKQSLKIKLTEHLLADCNGISSEPHFTVKKVFTAMNLGQLPLNILHMRIDNYPCEGYGFRVLDCEPFSLQPNQTKEITIAFTPDFTRSQIIRTLRIKTSQGTWLTFVLNVTLPHHMLAVCQSAFPRPLWEPTLRMMIGIMVVATFLGVMFVSFREAVHLWCTFCEFYDVELRKQAILESAHQGVSSTNFKAFSLKDVPAEVSAQHNIKKRSPWLVRMFTTPLNAIVSYDYLGFIKKIKTSVVRAVTGKRKHRIATVKSNVVLPPVSSSNSNEDSKTIIYPTEVNVKKTTTSSTSSSVSSSSSSTSGTKLRQRKVKSKTKEEEKKHKVTTSTVKTVPLKQSNKRSTCNRSPSRPSQHNKAAGDHAVQHTSAPLLVKQSHSSTSSTDSRRSSLSSGDHCEKVLKTLEKDVTKRLRKSSSTPKYQNDQNDDSSSTTSTSLEDFEIISPKEVLRNENRKKQSKRSSKREEATLSTDSSYHIVNPVLRRKSTESINSLSTFQSPSRKPRKELTNGGSPVSSINYDTTSSVDETIWEDPRKQQKNKSKLDADEGFRVLSEQTNKVDVKLRKKYGKMNHTPPPVVSSPTTSRSFSYSHAVLSTNDKRQQQQQPLLQKQPATTVTKSPLTKTKSMPVSSPASRVVRTSPIKTSNSVSADQRRRLSSNDSTTTTSVPPGFSIFSSPSSPERITPPSPDVVGMPEWTQFGQNSFNIAQGIIPSHNSLDNSGVLQRSGNNRSRWDFTTRPEPTWNPTRLFVPAHGTPPLPGSPTTPTLPTPWTSSTSTHAIWSVSNAVTMDEDRSVGTDPLGVSSIWSSVGRRDNHTPPSSTYQ